MKNEIAKVEIGSAMMVQGMTEQVNAIQLAMKELMNDGTHYGKIPGCGDKPALLKPGAEKLLFMFRFAPRLEIEKEDLGNGHREITVTANIYDQHENFLGSGVGSCSTMEKKYRYRNAGKSCPECGVVGTIFTSKEEYGGGFYCNKGKGGCGKAFKNGTDGAKNIRGQNVGQVENPDLADQYNTVLKMAKKRALVDATLTVTAASDIFEQDLDEFGEDELEAIREDKRQRGMKPKTSPPEEKKPETKQTKKAAKDTKSKPEDEAKTDTEKMDLGQWKNASNGEGLNVAEWWPGASKVALQDLGKKQFGMLENYIADVHSVKL